MIRKAILWGLLYVALVLAPLLLVFSGARPPGRGFWSDAAIALGYAAMGMLGIQFVLTARFRRATAPFGIDIIYYFHRYVALVMLAFVVVHAGILLAENPAIFKASSLSLIPRHFLWAALSFVLLAVLIAVSLWRKEFHISYELWRRTHGVASVAVLLLALAHVESTGYYLHIPWKSTLWTIITVSWLALLLWVRLIRPWLLSRKPYRVSEVRIEHGRACTLVLEPEDHPGLSFTAGQFAWVTLGTSPYSLQEHPFSIASSATKPGRLEFTIKDLGDFTHTVKDTPVGTRAYVDGPFGVFCAERHEDASGYVFIAGGAGIAPITSMLRTMAERGEKRPLYLFYGSRNRDSIILREECERLAGLLQLKVIHILQEPPGDWKGETGYLTQEILEHTLPADLVGLEFFICGPVPMIQVAERALTNLGVPLGRIHTELFDLV